MGTIGLMHFLILAAVVFTVGLVGVFVGRRNIISILLAIELMLLAVNINFISFSVFLQDYVGQLFTLFILTVSAAEVAIGLAILIVHFRLSSTINVEDISLMRG